MVQKTAAVAAAAFALPAQQCMESEALGLKKHNKTNPHLPW